MNESAIQHSSGQKPISLIDRLVFITSLSRIRVNVFNCFCSFVIQPANTSSFLFSLTPSPLWLRLFNWKHFYAYIKTVVNTIVKGSNFYKMCLIFDASWWIVLLFCDNGLVFRMLVIKLHVSAFSISRVFAVMLRGVIAGAVGPRSLPHTVPHPPLGHRTQPHAHQTHAEVRLVPHRHPTTSRRSLHIGEWTEMTPQSYICSAVAVLWRFNLRMYYHPKADVMQNSYIFTK